MPTSRIEFIAFFFSLFRWRITNKYDFELYAKMLLRYCYCCECCYSETNAIFQQNLGVLRHSILIAHEKFNDNQFGGLPLLGHRKFFFNVQMKSRENGYSRHSDEFEFELEFHFIPFSIEMNKNQSKMSINDKNVGFYSNFNDYVLETGRSLYFIEENI